MGLLWVTIRVAVVSTSLALLIGLPIGVALGIGRFRGRRTLQILANASLALPPVVVGIGVLLLVIQQGALGSLHLAFTLRAVYIAQTVLALPYIVALTPAAIQGLAPGLLGQARALGAGRMQLGGVRAQGGKDRRDRGRDRGARRGDLRGRRGRDRRRQHPGPRRDARERAARPVQLTPRTIPTRSRSRSCCWR